MVDVGQLNSRLTLMLADFEQGIGRVSGIVNKLDSTMKTFGKQMSKSIGKPMSKEIDQTTKSVSMFGSKTYGAFKDIGRIIQGIIVSQLIYRAIIGPLQEAIKELAKFQVEMEQTELAFEILLGGEEQGRAFVDMLEDFAAITPFVMENTTRMARQLLAVGFSVRETLTVMRGVVDAMAIMGARSDQLERLVDAIARIKAIGAELRYIKSIGKAGIPIYDILKKQLGVTEEQIRKGYLLSLPRSTVITAILKGINEAFKEGGIKLSRTLGGLASTIKDNMWLIIKDAFQPLYDAVKSYVEKIADRLQYLREAMRKWGVGGFFEALIPPNLREPIREIVAYFIALGKTIKELWIALAPLRKAWLDLWLLGAKLLLPTVVAIIKGLTNFIKIVMQSAIATRALAGAVIGLGLSIVVFRAALKPWMAILFAIAGALLAVASASATVSKWLSILKAKFFSLFGIDTSTILQPIEQTTGEVDLDATIAAIGDAYEDLEEDIEGANGALNNFLLSFDEIYRIPEEAENKIELPDLGELGDIGTLDYEIPTLEPLEEEIGDLEINFKELLSKLKDAWLILWRAFVDIVKEAGPRIWNSIKIIGEGIWEAIKIIGPRLFEAWKFLYTDIYPKIFATILSLIPPLLQTVVILTTEIMSSLAILLPRIANTLLLAVMAVLDSILTYGIDRIALLGASIAGMLLKIAVNLADIGLKMGNAIGMSITDGLIGALAGIGLTLINLIIRPLWEGIAALPGTFGEEGLAEWDKYISHSKELTNQFVREQNQSNIENSKAMKDSIQGNIDDIMTTAEDMTALLKSEASHFSEVTAPIWQQFGDDMVLTWQGTLGELKEIWAPALSDIGEAWVTWWNDSGKPIWEGTWSDFLKIWEGTGADLLKVGKITFEDVGKEFVGFGENLITTSGKAMSDLSDVFATGMEDVGETLGEAAGEIPKKMYETYDEIGKSYSGKIKPLSEYLNVAKGIENSTSEAVGATNTLFGSITNEISKQGTAISSFSEDVFKEIASSIESQEDDVLAVTDEITNGITISFKELGGTLKYLIGLWKHYILAELGHIRSAARTVALSAISAMNLEFVKFHPTVTVDVVYRTSSLPSIPTTTTRGMYETYDEIGESYGGLQYGGVALKETIARVGEGGKPEMVAPLSENALRPFASVIVSEMQNILNAGNIANAQSATPIYVGTLIADKKGIRELERRRYKVALEESLRRGD